jgi:C-terminal processing protease CtpA/Prc
VGEETGGGAYGNTAMHLPTIILPNSGIRVTLPLYRMVLDASRPKNGRGIFPDIEVKPTSFNIRRGVDGKIEKVRELIRKSNDTGIANVTK